MKEWKKAKVRYTRNVGVQPTTWNRNGVRADSVLEATPSASCSVSVPEMGSVSSRLPSWFRV